MSHKTTPLERIVARLPGSRWLWVSGFALVPVLAAFLPNSFVATVGYASIGRQFLAGAVFGYAVALSIIALFYFSRQLDEVAHSVKEYAPQEDLFKGLDSMAGPLVLTAMFSVAATLRTASLTDAETALLWLPISIVTNFPLMSAFWLFAVMFAGLRRLGRHRLSLDAFPRDPSLGLRSVGRLAYSAFWVYSAASAPILLVNVGDPPRLIMSLVIFLVGVALFFISLTGLHRQLLAARDVQISWARGVFADAYNEVRSGSLETLAGKAHLLLAAQALVDEAQSIQRWPFDDRRFRQIAALVGTFATFTATGVITRFVVLQLGLD